MYIEIKKDKLKDARIYMALGAKVRIAEEIAEWVVQPVDIKRDIPVPPMHKENRAIKNMLMLGILCRYYLGIEFDCNSINLIQDGKKVGEQPIDFYPTMEAYDELAESNIVNQLERLKKSDKEVSNIIFDMMYDFKCLENMVNSEIKDYVAMKNDLISRAVDLLELQVSKENLDKLSENLKELQEELQKGVNENG